ncbi:hypothetical protein TNCV_1121561 [Trichonephila clavipes]|nr:hypothetical protein TNCV_1121561 [Trichonephila clavipes]
MTEFSSSPFLPSDIGRVSSGERVSPLEGIPQLLEMDIIILSFSRTKLELAPLSPNFLTTSTEDTSRYYIHQILYTLSHQWHLVSNPRLDKADHEFAIMNKTAFFTV